MTVRGSETTTKTEQKCADRTFDWWRNWDSNAKNKKNWSRDFENLKLRLQMKRNKLKCKSGINPKSAFNYIKCFTACI